MLFMACKSDIRITGIEVPKLRVELRASINIRWELLESIGIITDVVRYDLLERKHKNIEIQAKNISKRGSVMEYFYYNYCNYASMEFGRRYFHSFL